LFLEVKPVYAIVETGSKQYCVSPGQLLEVEKVNGGVGETINLDRVLLLFDGKETRVGSPFVPGAKVVSEITQQRRAKKIIVFKFRRRTKYRRKQGHRQSLTRLRVKEIVVG
jgi:large subunit ribosomal protein L21